MPRVTVRVNVPSGPEGIIGLLESILREHERLATASPIPAALATRIEAVIDSAKPDRQQAADLSSQAQVLFERSNIKLGFGEGQSTRTPGTGLNLVTQVRDLLLAMNTGSENALEPFGFQVIVGTASSPKKKSPPP